MLRIYRVREFEDRFIGLVPAAPWDLALEERVREILQGVRDSGDAAAAAYGQMFDSETLTAGDLRVAESEIRGAARQAPRELLDAIDLAIRRLRDFHRHEVPRSWWRIGDDGTLFGQMVRPLERVGLYVPGGRAAYPSSLLMCAVPAQVAGVDEIVVCTPPGPGGEVSEAVLAAAARLGIQRVYRIGGAQAVAAMAFGTETVPAVDMVAGPGNRYVTAAKRLVYGAVQIDSLAGPSELAVLCDASADPVTVAADLLAQAEHDPEARAFLLATESGMVNAVIGELRKQIRCIERREVAGQALMGESGAVVAGEQTLWSLVNRLAPEHLSLRIADPIGALGRVRNAGCVVLGDYSAVSLSDYTAGPNHVLPTGGTARFASPLGVESFVKRSNVLRVTEEGFALLAGPTKVLARAEGLGAHARAVEVRGDPGWRKG
ncbi:MAG: histidinol dehydrogenase [Bacillota bacterium]